MQEHLSSPLNDAPTLKSKQRRLLLLLAVFIIPILSVVLAVGYGFAVWMSYLFLGPPA